ncbi:MAG: AraC family transcriptional regulator [Hyphomicrobium sp.]|uniref:helix-turn-helix domain-containing protein n=1 Tax=Hyphomicrobium sp. TaxID=82 RepID=UPI0039E6D7D4
MSLQLAENVQTSTASYPHVDVSLEHVGSRRAAQSGVLERLAKALVEAGVNPEKLDRHAEGERRLAIVANLFGLPVTAEAKPKQTERKPPSALPKWRLKRVVEYVDANIAEPLTLSDLAAAAGMSRMYFASQFKVATSMRPHEYVLHKRIEHAQHLLLTTAEPLVEIALSVGFQTQAHFTTIFKKISGNTPLRWRQEQRT